MTSAPRPQLALPLGSRSCQAGGSWETCEGASPTGELEAITVIARSPDDAKMLRREIKTSMNLASEGNLTYGKDSDVYASSTADLILEMRFDKRVQYPDGVRAVRLYFSEPDCNPDQLLAAHMAAKPATAAGLALQNDQMAEAQLRVERHLGL